MGRMEFQVLRKKRDKRYDWDSLGMKEPEGESVYVRLQVHTDDIQAIEEYTDKKSLLKCCWMESPVIVAGEYDALLVILNDIENADFSDPEHPEE